MVNLTYDFIQLKIGELFKSYPELLKYDTIIGLVRGGLVPATMISHQIDTKRLYTLQLSSYDSGNRKMSMMEMQPLDVVHIVDKQIIVVDDICDSGDTLTYFKDNYAHYTSKVFYYTIVRRDTSKFKTDYSSMVLKSDDWVKFPWEQ